MYSELKRTCKICNYTKCLSSFYSEGRDSRKGHRCKECILKRCKAVYSENKEAIKAQRKQYRDNNPEKMRDARYKADFNISLAEYNEMVAQQSNKCAICEQYETTFNRVGSVMKLAVDHNHTTGVVRGLLCKRCNITIGTVEEDTELLNKMVNYINKFKK